MAARQSASTAGRLIGFIVTGFAVHCQDAPTAIVYAHDREHAKRVLLEELRTKDVSWRADTDNWIIDPITLSPSTPLARVTVGRRS
jgi:hypothetical protein